MNPKLPIGLQARLVAQAIVESGFNLSKAVRQLRPELKCGATYGAKLLDDPCVLREIDSIMNRTERNSTKYVKMLWDWLEAENPDGLKDVEENRRTAARLLGKSYLDPRKATDAPLKPFHVDGQEEGIDALTVVKKVM